VQIFSRVEELELLRRRLAGRKSTLVHGPSGAGKTLLLLEVLPEFSNVLYCASSHSAQGVFRCLAEHLKQRDDATVKRICKGDTASLLLKSAISIKGIILDAFREAKYMVVLDHMNRPSQAFAAMVREIMFSTSTPVIAVARSAHMEDAGFVLPLLNDRSEKVAIKNFDPETAAMFAQQVCRERTIGAVNLEVIISNILRASEGNPGAILRMLEMASQSKYRTAEDQVKWAPLYIDFRMEWASANAV